MRSLVLALALLTAACGGPGPARQHPSPIKADCRPTPDGAVCVVGTDEEDTCLLFHQADRGEITRLREDLPRPATAGCRFHGYVE